MIMGVSSILLAVTFLVSAVPCLYLHMRRQNQLLKYWMNLEDYDDRLTNMMFGGGYDDRENKKGKGRRREKQPSQRWSRRSRRPNRKNYGHRHRHSRH